MQVIYTSSQINIPNIQVLSQISCSQDFSAVYNGAITQKRLIRLENIKYGSAYCSWSYQKTKVKIPTRAVLQLQGNGQIDGGRMNGQAQNKYAQSIAKGA